VLFNIFVDGLAEQVKRGGGARYGELVVSLLLFADDIVLVAESERMLQKMLDVVYGYCRKDRFRFNKEKSNVMVFGKRSNKDRKKFYLGESELRIVDFYKYLGLVLDKNFSWKEHLEKILDRARKRLKALCGHGLREGISARALLRGWQVLVRPVVEYGAEIWGEKKWEEGEKLQLEMGRRVLGVSGMTTREVIQGELGLEKMSSRRKILRLRFWYKLINMEKSRLVYQVYKQRREEFIKGRMRDKRNWCYWTWYYLRELQLEHIWSNETVELGENFDGLVRKLIKKKEEDEWREKMNKKAKLRLYRKLKNRLVLEDYVVDLDRAKSRELTMLRGGTNRLRIEIGRWSQERVEQRICKVCLRDEVEDETHFLLTCPMYWSERVEMVRRIRDECEIDCIENLEGEDLIQILIGIGWRKKSKKIRRIVVDYIKKANEIRKRYI